MSDRSATNDMPETDGADLNVPVGQNVVDGLRRKFATSAKIQRGDFYMDQSRELLQRMLPMIGHINQERLRATYTKARSANDVLVNPSHVGVRRFLKAVEYERRSKKVFKLVMKEYSQVIDNDLIRQIAETTRSRYRTLFSTPIDVAIGTFDRVEVETTQSEFAGEGPFMNPFEHDTFADGSRIVLVDDDDSADRVETRSIPSDIGREIFSPYSDCEEELSSEEELSTDE